jgi:membrane protease YdiL (CAAX protease family)
MKKIINWKAFYVLLAACVVGSVLVTIYQAGLNPALADLGSQLYFGAFLQGIVIFSVVTFLGLFFARKAGFELPVFESENKCQAIKAIIKPSVLWGLSSGVLITVLAFPFGKESIELFAAGTEIEIWKRLLACFYGGIAEEILMRLFVVSLLTWILLKIKLPRNASVWAAILVSSILFGLGHLPLTAGLTAITVPIVARSILLNGVGGVVFGALYWKKGLESAMIAHFSADIVLQMITPYIARLFIIG